jgi:hypothetical protein
MDKYNHWIAKIFGKLNRSNSYAVTFGQTAYYSVSEEEVLKSPKWIKHENRHKEQYAEYGFFKFLVKYIYYSIRYGYEDNPFEIDARKAEEK